jgi:cell division protein FtsB
MRYLAAALAFIILILQYPLWLGKGGWLRVWDLDRQVTVQKDQNESLKRRNAGLDAEVRDLKQGFEAVEERARYELGMVRPDEIFFQVIPPGPGNLSAAPAQATQATQPPGAGSATGNSAKSSGTPAQAGKAP